MVGVASLFGAGAAVWCVRWFVLLLWVYVCAIGLVWARLVTSTKIIGRRFCFCFLFMVTHPPRPSKLSAGNKADLVARLVEHYSKDTAATEGRCWIFACLLCRQLLLTQAGESWDGVGGDLLCLTYYAKRW